jgi:hypothetical protein
MAAVGQYAKDHRGLYIGITSSETACMSRPGCRVDVSPTDVSLIENSWMSRPLNKASLGYCAPDRCVPTLDCVKHGTSSIGLRHLMYQWGVWPASPTPLTRDLGIGWFGQGQNSRGTLCPRDATSKNFQSGTHRSGTD